MALASAKQLLISTRNIFTSNQSQIIWQYNYTFKVDDTICLRAIFETEIRGLEASIILMVYKL